MPDPLDAPHITMPSGEGWMIAYPTDKDRDYMRKIALMPFTELATRLADTLECTECDQIPNDEGTESLHGMIGEFVIIGCQGYHQIQFAE